MDISSNIFKAFEERSWIFIVYTAVNIRIKTPWPNGNFAKKQAVPVTTQKALIYRFLKPHKEDFIP